MTFDKLLTASTSRHRFLNLKLLFNLLLESFFTFCVFICTDFNEVSSKLMIIIYKPVFFPIDFRHVCK